MNDIEGITQDVDYPEVLAELAAVVSEELIVKHKFEEELAVDLGTEIAEFIRGHFSGQQIYFPKGRGFDLSRRDKSIIDEFNGRNFEILAKKHGLSVMRIRQIMNFERRRRQLKLF